MLILRFFFFIVCYYLEWSFEYLWSDFIYLFLYENRDVVWICWRFFVKSVINCLKVEISGCRDIIKVWMINIILCYGLKLKM